MDLKLLHTFQAVARLQSFSRAAENLHYSQSTVSSQIQMLEEMLGVPLFDRLGRTVVLTVAGEKLRQYAERLADMAEEARADVAGDRPGGAITIRLPDSLSQHVMPAVLERFRQLHPDATVRLTSCTGNTTMRDLRKGLVDVAFLLTNAPPEPDLCGEQLAEAPLLVLAARDHPLARAGAVTAGALAGEVLLHTPADCSYNRLIEAAFVKEGVAPRRGLELNSVAALKACLLRGLGVGALPRFAVRQELRSGALKQLRWKSAPAAVGVLMLHHRDKWQSPLMKAFMECARGELREL